MKWNSALYDNNHSFVSAYGKYMIDFVNIEKGQKILDLGCGTGILTKELAKKGADVVGVDSSKDMIAKAVVNYPDLVFRVEDATRLPFQDEFDTVFSNAVFHWITDQERLLSSIYRSLKDNGVLVCEFGAENNIRIIQTAFANVARQMGYRYHSNFFFPSEFEYRMLLEQAGFKAERIVVYDRPTPLIGGSAGLRNWISQFFANDLDKFSEDQKEEIFSEVDRICRDSLWKEGQWVADYRRIQAIAIKQA